MTTVIIDQKPQPTPKKYANAAGKYKYWALKLPDFHGRKVDLEVLESEVIDELSPNPMDSVEDPYVMILIDYVLAKYGKTLAKLDLDGLYEYTEGSIADAIEDVLYSHRNVWHRSLDEVEVAIYGEIKALLSFDSKEIITKADRIAIEALIAEIATIPEAMRD
ncbi:MAG: hypothetical protein ACRCXZ_01885 [Patescibacteria group bacterium]